MIIATGLLAAAIEAIELFSSGVLLGVTVYTAAKTGKSSNARRKKSPKQTREV